MKESRTAVLSVIVDAEGSPRNLFFQRPFATDMDRLVLEIVEKDHFTPGSFSGNAVAAAASLQITLNGCVFESTDSGGKMNYVLGLTSQPEQTVGPPVDPASEAVLTSGNGMSENFKEAPVDSPPKHLGKAEGVLGDLPGSGPPGLYEVKGFIDRQGMPEDIKLTESPRNNGNEILMNAVRRMRFKPAFRKGEPVVTRLTFRAQF
jgi:hypothetical protein